MPPTFDELPFNARPDLTPYLIHLTKNTLPEDEFSAYENLVSILETGEVWGSDPKKGFIKGSKKAACLMDVPFASLKYVLTPENADPKAPRYEPYGVAITKRLAYSRGCRPVLYLSNLELKAFGLPKAELWRVVRFEVKDERWISWIHEREWRCKSGLKLPGTIQAAFVRTSAEAQRLTKLLADKPKRFKCIPRSVIPCTVMCQGLLAE